MTSNTKILEKIEKTTTKTMIEVVKIKEHIKAINGSIERHEKNINELYSKSNENRLEVGKIKAIIGVIGAVAGAIGGILATIGTKLFGK